MPERSTSLRETVRKLRKHHGPPEPMPTGDAFELVLWENVAYLARPGKRREAFERLKATVGTGPPAILMAGAGDLRNVTSGGILHETFAEKLRECASIVIERFDGDLGKALDGSVPEAKKALRLFPGIGEPGAEKILLFSGRQAWLAPESNGLRVLSRLGLIKEEKSYARTYANSREISRKTAGNATFFQEAHLLLAHHGRTLCKRTSPACDQCPLETACAHARRIPGAAGGVKRPASAGATRRK